MEKSCFKQCQSCGMPLEKDPGKGGLEKDGVTHSMKWCSLCYENGEFIGKDCTLEDMKRIVDDAMKKENINWFIRKMAKWQIPYLKRWKQLNTHIPE